MAAKILSLTELSESIYKEELRQIKVLRELGQELKIVALLVGDSPHLNKNLQKQTAACRQAGIELAVISYPGNFDIAELDKRLNHLRTDNKFCGVMICSGSESRYLRKRLVRNLPLAKDVLCEHPDSLGQLMFDSDNALQPPLGAAVMAALTTHSIDIYAGKVVLIGNFLRFSLPLSLLLAAKHATLSLCSPAQELPAELIAGADVIISYASLQKLITKDMIKSQAVLLDLGPPGPGKSRVNITGGGVFSVDTAEKAAAVMSAGTIDRLEQVMLLHNVVVCGREM